MLECNKWYPKILQDLCRTFIRAVNAGYEMLESPLHHKQEVANTLICMEIAFYILTSCVLILHLYFNFILDSFSNLMFIGPCFIVQGAAERSPLFGKLINSKPKKIRQMFLFLESTQNAVLHQRVLNKTTQVAALNIDTLM